MDNIFTQTSARFNHRWVKLLLSLLLVVTMVLPFGVALGQVQTRELAPDEKAFVQAIAEFTASQGDMTGELIQELGYTPAIDITMWEQFPAIRKVEAAFSAAENAEPGNGRRMLALLAKKLSMEYEAVHYDAALVDLMQMDISIETRITFTSELVDPSAINLSPELRKAISRLSLYSDAGALGGPQGVMRYHFGLTTDKIYDILRASPSNKIALELGLSITSVPPSQMARLANLALDIRLEYEGARLDFDLDEIIKQVDADEVLRTTVDDFGQNRHVPGRSYIDNAGTEILEQVSDAGQRLRPRLPSAAPSVAQYADFATVASREALEFAGDAVSAGLVEGFVHAVIQAPFSLLTATPRGFGGVVFGNAVTDLDLPQVTSILWIPDQNIMPGESLSAGILEFTFADDTQRLVAPVLQEDIYAAQNIVFAGMDGLPALEYGNGVGLVGLTEFQEHYEVTEQGLEHKGRRANAVLHPALADLDLGWAVTHVDWFPTARSDLMRMVTENTNNESDIQAVEEWLGLTGELGIGTWKVIDAPLTVYADGNRLGVRRTAEPGHEYSEGLVNRAFIEMQGFSDSQGMGEMQASEMTQEWSQAFYALVPTLTQAIHEYERVNRFAQIFALIRWAENDGATFLNPPTKPDGPTTPGSLIVTNAFELVAAPVMDEHKIQKGLAEQLLNSLGKTAIALPDTIKELNTRELSQYSEVRAHFDQVWKAINSPEYQATQKELAQQRAIYQESDVGSVEERAALDRIDELVQEAQVTLAPAVPSFAFDEYQAILTELAVQRSIYWNAEIDSEEETAALDRIDELDNEAQSTLLSAFPAFVAYQRVQIDSESVLASTFPDYAKYVTLQTELAEQEEIYWSAEVGSVEESEAQKKMEELETELQAFLVDPDISSMNEWLQLSQDLGSQAERERELLISFFPALPITENPLASSRSLFPLALGLLAISIGLVWYVRRRRRSRISTSRSD